MRMTEEAVESRSSSACLRSRGVKRWIWQLVTVAQTLCYTNQRSPSSRNNAMTSVAIPAPLPHPPLQLCHTLLHHHQMVFCPAVSNMIFILHLIILMRVLCLNKFLPDIENNQLKSSGMYTFEKKREGFIISAIIPI